MAYPNYRIVRGASVFPEGSLVTVMFPGYFGIPHQVIRGGLWAKMKPSEQSLYVCLLHESERCSTRELQRTDAQLGDLSGLSTRAFCNARKKLQERGLISYKRGRGNGYAYTICDQHTGRPWPGHPKTRVPYKKKADALIEETFQQPAVPAAGWNENKKPAASLATPARSAVPGSSSTKPGDRLQDYGLPLSFKQNQS